MKKALARSAIALALVVQLPYAAADSAAVVQPFYEFLSNPGSETHAAALGEALADDWQSVGDYSGKNKSAQVFLKQVAGFGQLIPDLRWAMEDVIVAGDRVIVRGRATGTPTGPLFGVDGAGRSFDIMTIDIHTIENDKIVRSYHVEDWAGALRQLSGRQ